MSYWKNAWVATIVIVVSVLTFAVTASLMVADLGEIPDFASQDLSAKLELALAKVIENSSRYAISVGLIVTCAFYGLFYIAASVLSVVALLFSAMAPSLSLAALAFIVLILVEIFGDSKIFEHSKMAIAAFLALLAKERTDEKLKELVK
ncbi:hypothetical protein [Pontixanthobacter sp. CEM42]|uniref:hypothetical protein n=1 Tax=Pontixanthobacter sp. CEM42 TaxID=2792077 RepID=UPI001ADEEF6D|nr:hypothetical protein [Pontixanthobacter sp. CEM42]